MALLGASTTWQNYPLVIVLFPLGFSLGFSLGGIPFQLGLGLAS